MFWGWDMYNSCKKPIAILVIGIDPPIKPFPDSLTKIIAVATAAHLNSC